MATRSGKRRIEITTLSELHDPLFASEVEQLSGWSAVEFDQLLAEYRVPGHWRGTPCIALIETIRNRIDLSDKSYRSQFPPIFKALNLKLPALAGLLKQIKRHVVNAKKTRNNITSLAEEFPGLSMSAPEIGPHCKENGISPESLIQGASSAVKSPITNVMIIELFRYREKSNATWQTVIDVWWPSLFQTDKPPLGTVQSNWSNLNQTRQRLRQTPLNDFLNTVYSTPLPKPAPQEESDDAEDLDSDYESDLEFYPDFISGETLDHFGDCMEYLTDLWQDEVLSHQVTKEECTKKSKTLMKLERALEEAQQISSDLKKEVSSLSKKNVVRRLERRDADLEEKEKEVAEGVREKQKLNKKIQKLEENIKHLQIDKKAKGDSRRHFKNSGEAKKAAKKVLTKQVKNLEAENEDLKCQIDDIMHDKEVCSFENGKYTNDIRLVCFELIARGVGSRNVSDIIRIVLRDVGKMNVGRLPKPTLIRYLAVEQAMLNKECARGKIQASETEVTLHTDGTTKKRKGYTTILASTDEGTVGMSLHDIETESADALLEDTIECLDELVQLNVSNSSPNEVKELLVKVKNTMTDRCIVNKAYITKLENYRARILPDVTENWDSLSDDVKQEMATINDLYCGKHLVLNLQEYAAAALCEWEKIEAEDGKIGREKSLLWKRGKTESASLLTVRSFCNFLGPDCCEQSGMVEEFKAVVEKSHLEAYRGNRFNIPFSNSAAVFHHRDHFHQLCSSMDPQREANMFVKSLKADLDDDIILAGMRAMGMICQHVSTPLMKMIESSIHIMDTDRFYTRLHDKVEEWMIDPSPILNDSALLFPEFPPAKNDVHKSLYAATTESIENLTKQALSIIFHNFMVCISRQVADHLPGGRFHNASNEIRQQTTSCPKDNISAERIFAGLDYLRRKMPNANTVAFEGILLWGLNKTRSYLDEMDHNRREKYLNDARKQRKSFLQLYQRKSKSIKDRIAQKLQINKDKKIAKQLAHTKQATENTTHAVTLCGMVCATVEDVDSLKLNRSDAELEKALISQVKHWKTTCKGGINHTLFNLTKKTKKLTIQELEDNLKAIITQVMTHPNTDAEPTPGCSTLSSEEKELQRQTLKQKLLAKVSPSKKKRRGPFPGDRIVLKRIRHSFVDSEDGKLLECKGTVLRKATQQDLDELVEKTDRKLIQEYTFYTILYDPPFQEQLCYPLEKEWCEGTLELM